MRSMTIDPLFELSADIAPRLILARRPLTPVPALAYGTCFGRLFLPPTLASRRHKSGTRLRAFQKAWQCAGTPSSAGTPPH